MQMGWQGDDVPNSSRVENKITSEQDAGQTMSGWTSDKRCVPRFPLSEIPAQDRHLSLH